jgi:hypothetical protein
MRWHVIPNATVASIYQAVIFGATGEWFSGVAAAHATTARGFPRACVAWQAGSHSPPVSFSKPRHMHTGLAVAERNTSSTTARHVLPRRHQWEPAAQALVCLFYEEGN